MQLHICLTACFCYYLSLPSLFPFYFHLCQVAKLAWFRAAIWFFFLFRALEDLVLNCFLDAATIHKRNSIGYRKKNGLVLVQNSITYTSGLCGSQNSSECKSTCALAVAPFFICCFYSLNANILWCILV